MKQNSASDMSNKKTPSSVGPQPARVQMTSQLAENRRQMEGLFQNDGTFRVRELEGIDGCRAVLYFIDGMIKSRTLNEDIIPPLQLAPLGGSSPDMVIRCVLSACDCQTEASFETLAFLLSLGNTLLFIDQMEQAIVIDTKNWTVRAVEEPDNERVLQGPREGFNESLLTNLSLVRRRLTGSDFKAEFHILGDTFKNVASICYLESCVDLKVLNLARRRLKGVRATAVLDSNYIAEQIHDSDSSPFRTIGSTERPDIVAAKLLEGRIAIFCEGSPSAITAPFLFLELFQSNEDYYVSHHYASFQRILRITGFFVSVLIPAFFVALACYQPNLLPSALAITIAKARQTVPFSTLNEAILLLVIFDLLRESGARSPSNVGQALAVVSSIVLGQAAIEAGYIGAPILIITAFSCVTGVMLPRLIGASLLYRYAILLLTATSGYLGFVVGFYLLLLQMCSIESFGIPYTQFLYPSSQIQTGDVFLRDSWRKLRAFPIFSAKKRRGRS